MNKIIFLIVIVSLIILGCSKIPQQYKNNPCSDFCWNSLMKGLSPQFIETYGKVVAPECKKIENYTAEPEGLAGFERGTPTCNGEDSYCDCKLEKGEYYFDVEAKILSQYSAPPKNNSISP